MAIENGLAGCVHEIYPMLTVLFVILIECRLDLVAVRQSCQTPFRSTQTAQTGSQHSENSMSTKENAALVNTVFGIVCLVCYR
jgi:hypothetical protein